MDANDTDVGQRVVRLEEGLKALKERHDERTKTIDYLLGRGEDVSKLQASFDVMDSLIERLQKDLEELKQIVVTNERKRVQDDVDRRTSEDQNKTARRNQTLVLLAAIIAAVGGIIAAGVHPG